VTAAVRVICATPEATRALGARLARRAQPGDVLIVSGDLGAGKTCFVQGVAEGLGVAGPVTSPTFVLVA
jgi:tRNA threonylcarbamoyladenosine biosynthesis protein TsaE